LISPNRPMHAPWGRPGADYCTDIVYIYITPFLIPEARAQNLEAIICTTW